MQTEQQLIEGEEQKDQTVQHIYKPINTKFNICKFIQLYPSEITFIADNKTSNLIAVARSDCSIEIWNLKTYNILLKYQQNINEQITNIIFFQENLISFNKNGVIILYNLKKSENIQIIATNQGYIWDACQDQNQENFVIACESGFIQGYSLIDEKIIFQFQSQNFDQNRVLSLTYGKTDLYASFATSCIRKINKNRQVSLEIKIPNQKFAKKILFLENDQIVAGLSSGMLMIFETKFGTLLSQFQSHQAEIKTIVFNSDSKHIFASGNDSKIVSFFQVNGAWKQMEETRGQSHDCNSLVLYDNKLVQGGLTTDLCIYNLKNSQFDKKKHVKSLPQFLDFVTFSDKSDLILVRKPFHLELWQFSREQDSYQFNLKLQASNYICDASISQCSRYIAYSTQQETCLYSLKKDKKTLEKLKTYQIRAKLLKFTTTTGALKLVLIGNDRQIYCVYMGGDILSRDYEETSLGVVEESLDNAQHLEFGINNQSIIIGSKFNNIIHEYSLENGEKIGEFMSIFDQSINYTTFKFFQIKQQLVITYSNKKFLIFDLKAKQLSKYSRENGALHPIYRDQIKYQIIGVMQHPLKIDRLIFFTNYEILVVKTKRKVNQENSFQVKKFQKPIVSLIKSSLHKDLLIFETDFEKMVENLPGMVNTKKFRKY